MTALYASGGPDDQSQLHLPTSDRLDRAYFYCHSIPKWCIRQVFERLAGPAEPPSNARGSSEVGGMAGRAVLRAIHGLRS